jgi:hypothetical protein
MTLRIKPYLEQVKHWPLSGQNILAQFNADTIVVYQAYRAEIGHFAAKHQHFGGEFSFNRMSWIKPNFLWMMHRCGWGTKTDQEVILAVHLRRSGFDEILRRAVHSSYQPGIYPSPENWRARLAESPARLQWDPDHDPRGAKQERRALQLGLAGDVLRRYAQEWTVQIEDISEFVSEQRMHSLSEGFAGLLTPHEEVYPVGRAEVAARLGIQRDGGTVITQ